MQRAQGDSCSWYAVDQWAHDISQSSQFSAFSKPACLRGAAWCYSTVIACCYKHAHVFLHPPMRIELVMSLKLKLTRQGMSAGPVMVSPRPPWFVFSRNVTARPKGTRTELMKSLYCNKQESTAGGTAGRQAHMQSGRRICSQAGRTAYGVDDPPIVIHAASTEAATNAYHHQPANSVVHSPVT
jgi:hypothetical protein